MKICQNLNYDYKWINILQPTDTNSIITTPTCLNVNKCFNTPCFCCKTNSNCCIDATKQCNFIPDCQDESGELDAAHECTPIQSGFY